MTRSVRLSILTLPLPQQRYSCHGCGNCCRDFTVQLRDEDLNRLREQQWEQTLGEPVTITFRGVTYLRQRDDGACIFLQSDGKCRIHAEFGFANKPIACQLFPFHLSPTSADASLGMGLNFACQSVLENKGADLRTHTTDLQRMAGDLAELAAPGVPPLLTDRFRAEPREVDSCIRHIDRWLANSDITLSRRLDGLAWVFDQLSRATLEQVRGRRFEDLLDVLFNALPDELQHHPIDPPTSRQRKLLRQAVFARIEDPKLNVIYAKGRLKTILSQLSRSRRFRVGKGFVPRIGIDWIATNVTFEQVNEVQPAGESSASAIDDLMTRWLRATILGGRAWGAGYYGWAIVPGVQALLLNAACVGWLARLHAAGHGRGSIDLVDARAALGRIDRAAGRAPWLGGQIERMRLRYLQMEDGLRRLVDAFEIAH